MKTVALVAMPDPSRPRSDSAPIPVTFEIHTRPDPLLRMETDRGRREFTGVDLFACLSQAREELEERGLLLCCQGARPDVHPSGMQRQMDLGLRAYVMKRGGVPEEVDVFAPASPGQVGTLEEQRVAVCEFHNLPLPGGAGRRH